MNAALLIHAIVRQTTVLIAALATASGQRAQLASIANLVFADLVRELREQGVGNKIIADMCDPKVLPMDETLILDPTAYEHRVVLILERGPDDAFSGRIQLGEGDPPTALGSDPYDGSASGYWLCSVQLPTRGIEYTLREARRTRDRLVFEIEVGETWNRFCQTKNEPCPDSPEGRCAVGAPPVLGREPCECDGGRCTGADHALVRFDLAITPESIEGQLPFGGSFGTVAEVRLQRAR